MSNDKKKKREFALGDFLKIKPFLVKYKAKFIMAVSLGVIGSILNVFVPKYIQKLSGIIEAGINGNIDFEKIRFYGISGVAVILAGAILSYLNSAIMSSASLLTIKDIRTALNEKMDKVSISFYDAVNTGDILSRVTSDVDTVSKAISGCIGSMTSDIAMIVGSSIMMFITNWTLAVSVIVTTLLGMRVNTLLSKKVKEKSRAQRKILGAINGSINEVLTGHMVVKAFNCEDEILENFKMENDKLTEATWKSVFFSKMMGPVMVLVSNMSYVIICVIGLFLLRENLADVGVIAAFIVYVKMFSKPLSSLFQTLGTVQPSMASIERITQFLELQEIADNGNTSVKDVKGKVEFEHVRFGYLKDQTIIKDFSTVVEPGKKVAIVGPTGAGKSTIVNLLMRFYEINGGSIRIDGVPLNEIPRDNLHNILGMVLQETWCFEGTLRENIVYSTEGVSEERVNEVVDKVGLRFMVDAFPDGLDTVISDSSSVSAGQKQLITIARAMIKNAPILILDEATSSVDTRTEEYIQKSIDELCIGRTSFVIAHRLSTIRNADIIFVLKDGDIIETGNHDELLAKGGFYSELYNSQFDS